MNSLLHLYGRIVSEFGLSEFELKDLRRVLRGRSPDRTPLPLMIHRMCRAGLIERVSRGRYRAVHPTILILGWAGFKGLGEVKQRDYIPMISLVVSRLIECLGGKLRAIVLYGSVARGKALPESDIDLLIVADDLPRSYSERVKWLRNILQGLEEFRIELWKKKGLYPLVDVIALTPEEAEVNNPVYLDMVEEAVILFDRGFIEKKLKALRERLRALGARRVESPSGGWYWELKPTIRPGEVVEV